VSAPKIFCIKKIRKSVPKKDTKNTKANKTKNQKIKFCSHLPNSEGGVKENSMKMLPGVNLFKPDPCCMNPSRVANKTQK